jgi:hypothetical protein
MATDRKPTLGAATSSMVNNSLCGAAPKPRSQYLATLTPTTTSYSHQHGTSAVKPETQSQYLGTPTPSTTSYSQQYGTSAVKAESQSQYLGTPTPSTTSYSQQYGTSAVKAESQRSSIGGGGGNTRQMCGVEVHFPPGIKPHAPQMAMMSKVVSRSHLWLWRCTCILVCTLLSNGADEQGSFLLRGTGAVLCCCILVCILLSNGVQTTMDLEMYLYCLLLFVILQLHDLIEG